VLDVDDEVVDGGIVDGEGVGVVLCL